MNKNVLISLLVVVAVVLVGAYFMKGSKTADQEAASLRASQTPAYQNVQNTPTNANARGQIQPLACAVIMRNNPPNLPTNSIPQVTNSVQNVIFTFEVESIGCNPGDAYFNFLDVNVIPAFVSSSRNLRTENFTITNMTTGTTYPAYDVIRQITNAATAKFKVGADLSNNGIQVFEIRTDFNVDTVSMAPGDTLVFTVPNIGAIQMQDASGNPVTPSIAGLTAQVMSW